MAYKSKEQQQKYCREYYLKKQDEIKERSRINAKKRKDKLTPEEKIKEREKRKKDYKERKARNPEKYKQYYRKYNQSEKAKQCRMRWATSGKGKKYSSLKTKDQKEKFDFVANIKLKYGCMNPNCASYKALDSCCLDMHHLDPRIKLFNLASLSNRSLSEICLEIQKCTVLCANCHRLVSVGKLDTSKFKTCESLCLSQSDE